MAEVCINKGHQSNRVASEHMFGLMKIDGSKKFAKQKRNQANINHLSRWRRVQEKCNTFPFSSEREAVLWEVQCIYSFMLQSLQNVIKNEHESFSKMFTFLGICTYPWFNRIVNSFVSFDLNTVRNELDLPFYTVENVLPFNLSHIGRGTDICSSDNYPGHLFRKELGIGLGWSFGLRVYFSLGLASRIGLRKV